jgi:hypothetical protein
MKQLNAHMFEPVYKKLKINLDELGCVMVDIDPLKEMIDWKEKYQDVLYTSQNKNRPWIAGWIADQVAHITLLYGLLDNAHNWEKEIEQVLEEWELTSVQIDHVGFFESPYPADPYYCIVAHIKVSDALMEGHSRMEFLPHINTFTGFLPHMTIAYIQKDEQVRNKMVKELNEAWAGKKLYPKKGINLGYEPKSK